MAGVKIPPGNRLYFKYKLSGPTDGKYVFVYAVPGSDKILLAASSDSVYPDENTSLCSYEMFMHDVLSEISVGLDPFILNSKNQLVFKPELAEIFEENKVKDKYSVALKMDGDFWKYLGDMCYISIKNISSEPVEATFSVRGKFY